MLEVGLLEINYTFTRCLINQIKYRDRACVFEYARDHKVFSLQTHKYLYLQDGFNSRSLRHKQTQIQSLKRSKVHMPTVRQRPHTHTHAHLNAGARARTRSRIHTHTQRYTSAVLSSLRKRHISPVDPLSSINARSNTFGMSNSHPKRKRQFLPFNTFSYF